jgi:hypothetical protein
MQSAARGISPTLLRRFCDEFKLPNLTPLLSEQTPALERCTVVWEVMQVVLTIEKQREFLREFCNSNGDNSNLIMLAQLMGDDCNKEKCSITFKLITNMAGDDTALHMGMHGFFERNGQQGLATLLNKFGLETIAYNLQRVFFGTTDDERVLAALDELKFEANPERFVREMEKMIKTETEIMQSKMGSLNLQIQTLTGEKLALERELDGGVLVPDRAAALVGGRRGVLRSPDDFRKGVIPLPKSRALQRWMVECLPETGEWTMSAKPSAPTACLAGGRGGGIIIMVASKTPSCFTANLFCVV